MSVQSEITRLANAKTALATAIEGKGVTVPEGTKLDGMAALVEAISAGGGEVAYGTITPADMTGSFTQAETHNIYSKVFSIDTGATDVQQGIVYLRDAINAVTNGYSIIFIVITPDYSYCQKKPLTMEGTFLLKNGVISMSGTPYAAEFQAGHTYEWVVW